MAGEQKIVAAFDAAAESYDAWTEVQSAVARALVARAAADFARAPKTVLDIGAGTGHVTGFARANWPQAHIAALDAAPHMLARLKAKFPDVETIQADAAAYSGAARYDLILSSMALHWLADPVAALARWRGLLAPGGALHVAVPVQGSLQEWRNFLHKAGLEDSLWPFPAGFPGAELAAFPARFDSALAFARSLKRSGAHTAAPDGRPLPAPALRKALTAHSGPFDVTFQVAFIRLAAASPRPPAR
ncbi:malonyl-CoA O-methyltransferase [Rhodoblastus acidophilus]|uniref:methyltransferase domain-containing protein n=1 Tax=Rhodoblastus acidophilus TaxID=1074 RepID=UPI002224963E|nr:methyltransferase domain-containing protein [Rhodoblastus acidophilus]MCW2316838.1 malonyl-CoA O-methyltransferase [Rhodoblastus acidophilus]